jgi:hypothetical protein
MKWLIREHCDLGDTMAVLETRVRELCEPNHCLDTNNDGRRTLAFLDPLPQKLAETPPRLRTKPGGTPRYREPDNGAEAVRRRRSTANRVLTILKAALNHPTPKGNVPTMMHGGRSVPSAKPMQRGCVICQTTRPVD